ncbi:hypothetical protein JCM16418_3731 [Paenibacillus pini JCM 16418]|uniref:Uncharacterized protein n=2 Tax=Paenibacillus TaxID=44249 RepID=W7YY87_9BACL|nr:hypothetical protein JCM16418_3731 [Paenibacillus pini JCM 16418]
MISTHMKHSNIDDAMDRIHDAQNSLNRFGKELKDVQMVLQIDIDIGSFLKFADYFWDGFISDWMVQGRINDTLSKVQDKRSEVQGILRELEGEYIRNQSQMQDIERKYNSVIELAN